MKEEKNGQMVKQNPTEAWKVSAEWKCFIIGKHYNEIC